MPYRLFSSQEKKVAGEGHQNTQNIYAHVPTAPMAQVASNSCARALPAATASLACPEVSVARLSPKGL